MNFLPFHNTLKIQRRSKDISGNVNPWINVLNPDDTTSIKGPVGPIFKNVSNADFQILVPPTTRSFAEQDISNNKYINTNKLDSSDVYQFRIALTNLVYEDTVSNEEKWNYLYIPDASGGATGISGEFIQLGSFGPPYPPTSINFFNTTYQSADISGSTINNADASLNTPFPITFPPSTLAVKYQFDLSGSPAIGALQQPANQNITVFDVSFVSDPIQQNNFSTRYFHSSTGWKLDRYKLRIS